MYAHVDVYEYTYTHSHGISGKCPNPLEVIKGWDEGVKGMLKGEQRRLLVPSKLGYGASGCPPVIPPRADLVFEVELL